MQPATVPRSSHVLSRCRPAVDPALRAAVADLPAASGASSTSISAGATRTQARVGRQRQGDPPRARAPVGRGVGRIVRCGDAGGRRGVAFSGGRAWTESETGAQLAAALEDLHATHARGEAAADLESLAVLVTTRDH
jgi:hypothetical protein